MMRRIHKAAIVLLILLAASSTHAADAVKVNKAPPAIEHRSFNRAHPPADMPPLEGEEAAVTKSVFGIESEFSVEVLSQNNRNGKTFAKIKVAGVTVNLTLRVTIWVPQDAPKTIIDHEEGHRQISEYFYKDADKVARNIAQKYIGQTYQGEGTDADAASRAALDKVLDDLSQGYMAQIQGISVKANEIFDEITVHGRNQKISVEKAMKQSIDRAKKEKEKK
ncbi:MAG TPA: hypothetical protein VGQ99_00680 [Tepidisphaeraceae bacterium]|jgi:hypothetical protein|nr:hypothetical protein [Tepidisphaeraceae bacterium]